MNGSDGRRAVWGVTLMLAGLMLFFYRYVRIPFLPEDYVWWGGIVTAIGLLTIATARRAESVGTGVTVALIGLWIVLVTNRMFGLHWYNSWPLALVAAGAGTVAHAIAAYWLPDTKKEQRRAMEPEQEAPHA